MLMCNMKTLAKIVGKGPDRFDPHLDRLQVWKASNIRGDDSELTSRK
jgi:hypothetical protein